MDISVDNLPRTFVCKICNKNLSSYKSLWRHNNTFHNNDAIIPDNELIIPNNTLIIPVKNYNCRTCQRPFNNFQNRWKHEKICKAKADELAKSKAELQKTKAELQKAKLELSKTNNINKQINSNNTNNNCHNTTNNNNGIINNITINAFGKEDLSILGPEDIKKLIKNDNPLIDIISLLNFNEQFPENHSFCNTSLEGNYVSVLNTESNKVEKINKNVFYDKVLMNSFDKIDQLSSMLELDESLKETLKEKYKKHLDKKIKHTKNTFFTDKVYKNCYKTNINEMSYNNKDMVLGTWSKRKDKDDDSVSTLATEESLDSETDVEI